MTAQLRSLADERDERESGRLRHPALRMPIDLDRMRRREAERLADAGHPWPAQAALLLAARGRLGLDRRSFADAVGVPESIVASIEDGVAGTE